MKERRTNPRYEVALKVRFRTKKAFQDAIIHSLSSGGLFLATETPFNLGHQFPIEIDLPKKKEWIKGTCEVVWLSQSKTKDYPKWIYEANILKGIAPQQIHPGMGVQFVEILPKYKKRLEEYLGAIGKV